MQRCSCFYLHAILMLLGTWRLTFFCLLISTSLTKDSWSSWTGSTTAAGTLLDERSEAPSTPA